jgi:feruloyl esterase
MKLGFLILALILIAGLPVWAATSCEDLGHLTLANATVTTAQSVPAGDFTPPGAPALHDLPAFCRVALTLKPSADSDILLEVWMPASGWNGKFQGVGNGGFAGSISFSALGQAISHGYASASTDTGHHAIPGIDATWALNHPEKTIDFGYRAIHESAVQAKALIRAFYGEPLKRSYFSSCSNGGRQALMEAQRYPEDYDGIIAGAPANYWTHLLTEAVVNSQNTLSDPASYIPAAKLPAIESAALAACDLNDGVKDGVIENPGMCKFDPAVLLCKGEESGNSCLTEQQLTALKKIYAGPRTSAGEQIMPGYSPGGEAEPGGWAAWITGGQPQQAAMFGFGTQFFKNMVFSDPAWDFKTFNPDRDMKVADQKAAAALNATDPDLKKFKARGGKLILYHGWSDAAIPATNVINYYESVVKKMGQKDVSDFTRLYMVPGMQHCAGGPSPTSFGQGGVPTADAQHDLAAALELWVEKGVAPQEIIATKYKSGTPASGVARTRPLCTYPQTAHYKGSGSTDDAANFVCK